MLKALVWLIFVYAALKLASVARVRPAGFRRTEVRLRDRLLAREPALLVLAGMIAVPLALVSSWYGHRTLQDQYEHAVACYGRIVALKDVPGFGAYLEDSTIYEGIERYRATAGAMAVAMDMPPAEVSEALAARVKAFSDLYAAEQGQGQRQAALAELGAGRDCVRAGATNGGIGGPGTP